MRWWDGSAWGPYAPTAPPTGPSNSDRTMAIFSHLGFLAGGFILPLIMYVISGDQLHPQTRNHAREALNFQITFMIAWFGMFALFFGSIVISASSSSPPFGLVVFPLLFVVMAANIGLSIVGATRAASGSSWRYPVCLRLIRQ